MQLALAYAHALQDRTDLSLPLVHCPLTVQPSQANRQRFAYGLVAAAWCAWVRADPALDFVDDEVRRPAEGDDHILA